MDVLQCLRRKFINVDTARSIRFYLGVGGLPACRVPGQWLSECCGIVAYLQHICLMRHTQRRGVPSIQMHTRLSRTGNFRTGCLHGIHRNGHTRNKLLLLTQKNSKKKTEVNDATRGSQRRRCRSSKHRPSTANASTAYVSKRRLAQLDRAPEVLLSPARQTIARSSPWERRCLMGYGEDSHLPRRLDFASDVTAGDCCEELHGCCEQRHGARRAAAASARVDSPPVGAPRRMRVVRS
ncbi:hypothetical protein B0H21DRAFT_544688 [Amylocystis lapponica]|nr:hypothetical protein B0H21DRAFT_544688 [Amylocystis lapponica]